MKKIYYCHKLIYFLCRYRIKLNKTQMSVFLFIIFLLSFKPMSIFSQKCTFQRDVVINNEKYNSLSKITKRHGGLSFWKNTIWNKTNLNENIIYWIEVRASFDFNYYGTIDSNTIIIYLENGDSIKLVSKEKKLVEKNFAKSSPAPPLYSHFFVNLYNISIVELQNIQNNSIGSYIIHCYFTNPKTKDVIVKHSDSFVLSKRQKEKIKRLADCILSI